MSGDQAIPGLEHVRELEIPTPAEDCPFSLRAQVARPTSGRQSDLFEQENEPPCSK